MRDDIREICRFCARTASTYWDDNPPRSLPREANWLCRRAQLAAYAWVFSTFDTSIKQAIRSAPMEGRKRLITAGLAREGRCRNMCTNGVPTLGTNALNSHRSARLHYRQ